MRKNAGLKDVAAERRDLSTRENPPAFVLPVGRISWNTNLTKPDDAARDGEWLLLLPQPNARMRILCK